MVIILDRLNIVFYNFFKFWIVTVNSGKTSSYILSGFAFFLGMNMIINRILNNNVVVSSDENENEIVVMGKGLGFGMKVGNEINLNKIEKTFTLVDRSVSNKFQQIIANIPIEHILITEKIIDFAVKEYGKQLNDSIYVSLTDHISSAIERYKAGIILPNPLLLDIKRIYRDEFKIGEKAVDIMRTATGIEILNDEAGFIALHFVNAELNIKINDLYSITKIIEEISIIVKEFYSIEFDEDSVNYYRFINHLKFFAQRIISKEYCDDDSELYDLLISKYPRSFECVDEIVNFIKKNYNCTVSKEERFYLSINIKRMMKNID